MVRAAQHSNLLSKKPSNGRANKTNSTWSQVWYDKSTDLSKGWNKQIELDGWEIPEDPYLTVSTCNL